MAGSKSNQAQIEERVNIVMDMLLSGLNRRDIIRNITNNEELKKWEVSNRTIDVYISKANDILSGTFEKDRDNLVNHFYNQYRFLYKKMVIAKDYKGAMAAVDKLAEFTGAKPAEKIDIKLKADSNLDNMTFEQLMQLKYGKSEDNKE